MDSTHLPQSSTCLYVVFGINIWHQFWVDPTVPIPIECDVTCAHPAACASAIYILGGKNRSLCIALLYFLNKGPIIALDSNGWSCCFEAKHYWPSTIYYTAHLSAKCCEKKIDKPLWNCAPLLYFKAILHSVHEKHVWGANCVAFSKDWTES